MDRRAELEKKRLKLQQLREIKNQRREQQASITNRDISIDSADRDSSVCDLCTKLKIYCQVAEFDVKLKQELIKNPVLKNYQSLLESGKFSDAALIIGDKELPVHKAILGAQSKVFAAMFENDCKEKRQNRVEITDISVEVCKQMLRYIYSGIVIELDEFASELFVAADKYELDHLKEACEQHMVTSIETDSVANILLVADMYNANLLKTKCIEFVIKHGKEVIASEGWKVLTKARPELVIQLFERIYNEK